MPARTVRQIGPRVLRRTPRHREAHLFEQHLHVVPDVFLGAGVAQQIRRMIGDQDRRVAIFVEAAAEFADGDFGFEEGLGGNCADADDVVWTQNFELALKILPAVIGFLRQRVAVVGRAAFEDVHNIDVGALPAASFDDLGEKLPGTAHEWFALAIFVGAWSFAEKHDSWLRVADTEDCLSPRAG